MSLLDLLFPKKCLQCGAGSLYLCQKCIDRVRLAKQVCVECQRPAIDGITHVGCLRSLGLHGCLSGFEYKWVIKKAIKSIKYRFASDMAEEIAGLLVTHLQKNVNALPKESVLVPIPLHKKRQNWRGFNQAEELGRVVAKKMGWPLVSDLLIRTRSTVPQVDLEGDQRRSNVQGIFSLHHPLPTTLNTLIIFDDVITTGATVSEACKVIKRRNKELKIWGLSVAR